MAVIHGDGASVAGEEESHIEGKSGHSGGGADVEGTKFQCFCDVILLGVCKNGVGAFYVAICGFHLYKCAFTLISNNKINLKSGVFAEIIQSATYFAENICD